MGMTLFPEWIISLSDLLIAFAFFLLLIGLIQLRKSVKAPSLINLLPSFMESIQDAENFESGLQTLLEKICKEMDWDYAEAWIPDENDKVLKCSSAWFSNKKSFIRFYELSRELRFGENMAIEGTVWATKKYLWLSKIYRSSNSLFVRNDLARKFHLKTALAVPILDQDKVITVLVFVSRTSRREDLRVIHFISAVAGYLVSIIQRQKAEDTLTEAYQLIEKRIQEKTENLVKSEEAMRKLYSAMKGSEETSRELSEDYKSLLASIDGIVWEYDIRASKFTFISQQLENMLGYIPQEWMGEPSFWKEHIHGADRDEAVAFHDRVVKKKTDEEAEYRMITADGHARWFRDMVSVVIENGEAVKLRGTMVDITDQKLAEDALNQERNFTEAILDTTTALVVVLDRQGKVVRLNSTAEEIIGYKEIEIKGRYFWDLFSSSQGAEETKSVFNRLMAGQFPASSETEWQDKLGNHHVIAWSSNVLLNREKEIVHLIATGLDITKRKEMEQKLKEAVENLEYSNRDLDRSRSELMTANDRLKKLDELKSQFVSAASHELKTPLTSIKGYVESILEGEAGPLNEQQKKFLECVRQATDRLHRLLSELLDISKIESGQIKMNKDWTNMKSLLKEEIMIFKPKADEKHLQLELEVNSDLKEVFCDSDKIREVFDNLISNAIKYTTPKGGKIKIFAQNMDSGVQIQVRDCGIGIKTKDLPKLFEPFQSIEKQNTGEHESSGLGLALTKKIVEVHDGRISVESKEGKGSVFTVLLPAGKTEPVELKSKAA